jgi:23S rRNA (pseudouridine1915-N3)-methyltransferase
LIEIRIISVGKRAPSWIQNGCQEYLKRLGHELNVNLHEIQTPKRSKNDSIPSLLEKESELIQKDIPEKYHVIALDEKGQAFSTRDVSSRLDEWQLMDRNICFIIGGPDGLHHSIKESANELWSLSMLTLPHMMVRVVLLEQIYRAWCVLKGHPYHRA